LAASLDGLLSSRRTTTDQIVAISAKPFPVRSLQAGALAGETDKSRRYLRWAAANEERAANAYDEELKTLLLRIAAQYRDLAEQIDDPEQWRAKPQGPPESNGRAEVMVFNGRRSGRLIMACDTVPLTKPRTKDLEQLLDNGGENVVAGKIRG
jgi:hypothetical protein